MNAGIVRVSFSEADYAELEDVGQIKVTVMKEDISSGPLAFNVTPFTYDDFYSAGLVASAEFQAKALPSAAQCKPSRN